MSLITTQVKSFADKIVTPLKKTKITVLQINLGKKCNLACNHCHVEASPLRTEELTPEICDRILELIERFPQIETVDLTGGATEMHYGFKPILEKAKKAGKEVIVRTNLTIYFQKGYEYLPEYCANHQVRIVASLPCYLPENVDKMRGKGVFNDSIKAIHLLNQLGYGSDPNLILDFVYNPQVPVSPDKFSLPPNQQLLEQDYKMFLKEHYNIIFNHLFTITNLPIGRTKIHLQKLGLFNEYEQFLEQNYNGSTLDNLMCKNQLSIDYLGNVYDCDFNQMEQVSARTKSGEKLTLSKILQQGDLDIISQVQTADYCYGCTAGSGSSCGGAIVI
jgi:radical SAM/Cys-rich protein